MKNFSRAGSILAGGIHQPMTTFRIEDSPSLEEQSTVGVREGFNKKSLEFSISSAKKYGINIFFISYMGSKKCFNAKKFFSFFFRAPTPDFVVGSWRGGVTKG